MTKKNSYHLNKNNAALLDHIYPLFSPTLGKHQLLNLVIQSGLENFREKYAKQLQNIQEATSNQTTEQTQTTTDQNG